MREYRKRNRERGLCNDCSQPALEGTVHCHIHTISKRTQNKNHNARYRAKYIAKYALRYKQRKENGQCVRCGRILHDTLREYIDYLIIPVLAAAGFAEKTIEEHFNEEDL